MDELDGQIILGIRAVREAHYAATARAVADFIGVHNQTVAYRMRQLRDQGLVDWDDMPGSLHLTDAGRTEMRKLKRRRARRPVES